MLFSPELLFQGRCWWPGFWRRPARTDGGLGRCQGPCRGAWGCPSEIWVSAFRSVPVINSFLFGAAENSPGCQNSSKSRRGFWCQVRVCRQVSLAGCPSLRCWSPSVPVSCDSPDLAGLFIALAFMTRLRAQSALADLLASPCYFWKHIFRVLFLSRYVCKSMCIETEWLFIRFGNFTVFESTLLTVRPCCIQNGLGYWNCFRKTTEN